MKIYKSGTAETGGILPAEELDAINAFAKGKLTAEEVYTFSVLLCDNDVDRDNERFSEQTLSELRELFVGKTGLFDHEYINPQVVLTPQEAFYAAKEEMIPIRETKGRVCTEFVMSYPPGIPILAPGERITQEIIDYILYAKEKGCSLTGPEDEKCERLNVIKERTIY